MSIYNHLNKQGTAREIAAIFLGMGAGLICGMGYIGFTAAFAVVLEIIIFAFNLKMADDKATNRTLRITVPEDLDFAGQFDEILSRYTADNKLVTMKNKKFRAFLIALIAADDAKVEIVLKNASIPNDTSAAIYVKNAKKTFITLADGKENSLSTTGTFEADGDTNVDGVIFSKEDLTIRRIGTFL